ALRAHHGAPLGIWKIMTTTSKSFRLGRLRLLASGQSSNRLQAVAAMLIYGRKRIGFHMPQIPKTFKTQNQDPLATEEQAFEEQRAKLLCRYEGQFVALFGRRVVGHDKDAERLAARLSAELGDVPFFIARVEERPSVYDLPSPEIEH